MILDHYIKLSGNPRIMSTGSVQVAKALVSEAVHSVLLSGDLTGAVARKRIVRTEVYSPISCFVCFDTRCCSM